MKEARLIVNPSSGKEESSNYAERVQEVLHKSYDTVSVRYTEKAGDATRFAQEAAEEQVDSVFLMGGDGTMNEGMNGLAERPYRPKFGFIPMGTMNDLGRALGISMDPEEAIEQLANLRERKLDIGKINDSYFIDVVAVGKLPEAVHSVDTEQKTKFGPLAYFMEGARALKDSKEYTFQMNIDGEEVEVQSMLLAAALTNSVGGFEQLLPHAKVDDGKLHLVLLMGESMLDKLKVLPKILTGKAVEDDNIFYRAFEKATIRTVESDELVANVDGDEGDSLPLTLQVLPQHITVLVPEESVNEKASS